MPKKVAAEFAVQHRDGTLSDFDLWKDILSPGELAGIESPEQTAERECRVVLDAGRSDHVAALVRSLPASIDRSGVWRVITRGVVHHATRHAEAAEALRAEDVSADAAEELLVAAGL